ncbi:MAG: hypothetical protein H8E33_03460 [Candidatus Cloacimonetes bacterium]|nr:hypothetical protein [Candidatus Cloacimonadota bacterium]
MKKVILISIISLFSLSLLAQNTETVIELKMERELAERIENLLFPIIGKTVVLVDLTLKYPSEGLIPYGMEFDESKSLPGLPIAKSKGILPKTIEGEATLPTQILSKKIVLNIAKNISDSKVEIVSENIKNWFHLDLDKDDVLEIKKVLEISEENIEKRVEFFENPLFIILLVFLLILLIFIFIFRNSIKNLGKSMNNVNISGLDKPIRIQGDFGGVGQKAETSSPNIEISQKEPLPIRILKEEIKTDSTDFHFLEELSTDDFISVIEKEKPEELAFILANLSGEFSNKFFQNYKGDSDKILKNIMSSFQKTNDEIKAIREKLFAKYLNYLENKKIAFEGEDTIKNIINNLPPENAIKMFKKIEKINPKISQKIRENIFLFDDIENLHDNDIERIIQQIDNKLLASFLVNSDSKIQNKFFKNMTERAVSFLKEDIELLHEFSDEEKKHFQNEMLSAIRKILKF